MTISPAEAEQMVLYQIGALYGFCRGHGVELEHVKPHGALYNQAAVDRVLAGAIARGIARFSRTIPLVALAGSFAYREAAEEAGLRLVPEAFADRRYNPDGTLQSRAIAGSVLVDPRQAAEQVLRIVCEGTVVAHDGTGDRTAAILFAFMAILREHRVSSPQCGPSWRLLVLLFVKFVIYCNSSALRII